MAQRIRGPLGSSDLNGSENYVWSMSDILGRGATAIVYKGVHKATGEPAAVKTFTGGLQKQQMNELELLQKLDHENVVKLLAIETEVSGNTKVAVMELCEGQSLFNILDDPENAYGLNEKEFLLVLQHLAAGLKYLRDNDISHRDLKPGNIVKYITENGRHVYKLTDFGAARAIADNEYFFSLCGTEEYLYPDIYDKAVMKCSEKKAFTPRVDLWSMGCTIYHVATGSLPFRPYKGRVNRHGMQFIHMNKQSGVISAIQHENGRIEWSKELPKTCLLSVGLREIVTPLLQALLEKEKTWSFKDFFTEVDKILDKKQFHIFNVHTCTEYTLYLDPDDMFRDLQIQVRDRTQISLEHQILIQNGVSLVEHIKPSSPASTVLEPTSQTEPILLLSSSHATFMVPPEKSGHLPVSFPNFDIGAVAVDHDALKAKNLTGAAYMLARHVVTLSRCHNLLLEVPAVVRNMIGKKIEQLSQLVQQIVERSATLECIFLALVKYTSTVLEFIPLLKLPNNMESPRLSSVTQDRKQELHSIRQTLKSVQDRTIILQTKYGFSQRNDSSWRQGLQQCQKLTGRKETSDTYVKSIRQCWQTMDKFKNLKPLSFNEEQFHQLEKNKIARSKEKLCVLNEKCSSALQAVVKELDCWYNESQTVLVQCDCLTVELNQGISQLRNFEGVLKESQDECERIVAKIVSMAKTSKRDQTSEQLNHITNGIKPDDILKKITPSFLQELQDLKMSQNELRSLIQENHTVIDQLHVFSSQLGQYRTDDSLGNDQPDKPKGGLTVLAQ